MTERKTTLPQSELLKLLYKFRYANSQLLATHKNKSKTAINKTLKILLNKKFVGRNYNKNYKLVGRGAEYYLTNAGILYLRDNYKLNKLVLHAMYKNKSLGQPFIQKCLLIYQVYIQLQKQYGDMFTLLTKTEVADIKGFPTPLQDLFIYSDDNEYLLDIFTDNLFYLIKKRIDQLIEHYESGDWPEKDYPTLLLVFTDSRTEAKARAYIEKSKDDNYIDDGDLIFMTTTQKALLGANTQNIWTSHNETLASL